MTRPSAARRPTPTHRPETPGSGGRDFLERLRRLEPEACETLVREHTGRLLAVTRRILRDEESARDAVQEAFAAAFRSVERFDGRARLSTWLHRIAVNFALMRVRARACRPEEPLTALPPGFESSDRHLFPASEWQRPADERIQTRQLECLVRGAIDRLPESYRTVLVLRDIQEQATDETARAMGITPNAAKIRLHRARHALRALLEPLVHSGAA